MIFVTNHEGILPGGSCKGGLRTALIIELCVINGIQGATLKHWPEFVEGLFGRGLAGKNCLFCKFLVSFVLQRPIKARCAGFSGLDLPATALGEKYQFFSNKYLTRRLYLVKKLETLQGSSQNTRVVLWNWRKESLQTGKRMKRQ